MQAYSDVCEFHYLKTILEARQHHSSPAKIRLVVKSTTGAVFEGLMTYDGSGVIGDINRLDWTADRGLCVKHDYLQLFCNCKNMNES